MANQFGDPGQHRLRQGRVSLPGQPYLLTTVTHRRQPLFANLWTARIVVNSLRHYHEHGRIHSLAYVLMPDHLHWLLKLREGESLSAIMRTVKAYSARQIEGLGHEGPIWQKGFHDRALRKEEDLLTAARYLVANPLRAGLAQTIGEYPHWDAVWLGEDGG